MLLNQLKGVAVVKIPVNFSNLIIPFLSLATISCGSGSFLRLGAESTQKSSSEIDLKQATKDVVSQAQENTLKLQINNKLWDMPSYLGLHYTSQYYLFLRWTGREKQSALDSKRLRSEILNSQLPTGGWITVRDHLKDIGDINATIMNYAALKAMGEPSTSQPMAKARSWILKNGGIEKGSTFTKIFFALFSQSGWDVVPNIPFFLFDENSLVYPGKIFAQWITPHLYPMTYLKTLEVHKNLGSAFSLDELRTTSTSKPTNYKTYPQLPPEEFKIHLSRMLKQQQSGGSFGAYTLATIFSIMAIDDFKKTWPEEGKFIDDSVATRGMQFLDLIYVKNATNTYLGVVDDGHIWDTLLIADALLTSGVPKERLADTAKYLASRQVANGGIPFGNDFDRYPDTDDTALVLPTFARYPDLKKNMSSAGQFLVNMQNSDGGLGAFAKNNYPIPLVELFAANLKDSADLFDESSADVIGHALEGIGRSFGPKELNHPFVKNSMKYLEKTRDAKLKAWPGRWGVSYLYGTSAVISGMSAIGFPTDHEFIREGLEFLVSRQNTDGGFGEISTADLNRAKAGVGPSTPSQTAWVLMALLTNRSQYHSQIERAVRYLNAEFKKYGKWQDGHAVGTGHPQIIYMEYPSYPYAFPLKALGHYLESDDLRKTNELNF